MFPSPAWAHLILYGEEATKQAQKEGEEAAAAYEQEKKDIAEGKIPATSPKQEKKKKQGGKKKAEAKDDDDGDGENKPGRKRGRAAKDDGGGEKKKRVTADKESLAPLLAKGVAKVSFRIQLAGRCFNISNYSTTRQLCWPRDYSLRRLVILI